ncbi:capsule-associated protein-like protein CAP1 [Pyrenochaeta sp. MPI-SDFR-AT-0127]|nr:capsule-associated protein-like protein CAP1 [Pyrenochaeta sp. MPI-SDFR-AT-0127]
MRRQSISYITFRNIFFVLTGFSVFLICSNARLLWEHASRAATHRTSPHGYEQSVLQSHPIGKLMATAQMEFQALLSGQIDDLHSAAEKYRKMRGRHPPPGFDAWFEYARNHDSIIIEELFDQIYHDLTPFWGVEPQQMRDFGRLFEHHISIRNGTANMTKNHNIGTAKDRMEAWLNLTQSIQHFLPDLDMAINVMDESRVIVPWENITKYVHIEAKSRRLLPKDKTVSRYRRLKAIGKDSINVSRVEFIGPGQEVFWDTARVGCDPRAPARHLPAVNNFTGPSPFPSDLAGRSLIGYVKNWTWTRDACQQPHLQESHGTFIEPVSVSTTRSLVPIFGESKLSMNNDILIPPAAYLSESFSSGLYSDANAHGGDWSKKAARTVWRGVASGGRNRKENWTRFHRHRFVSMLNGTYIQKLETNSDAANKGQTFELQSYAMYNITATKTMDLGVWLNRIADVGFTNLECFPSTGGPTCNYTDPYYTISPPIKMSEQYDYKLLPDVDGNSFSGRYLAFLRSTSVPIKATIYSEWHDDRLIPWLHFVPMDNSFADVYGILDYFLGTGGGFNGGFLGMAADGAHDDQAKIIASHGKEWTDKVLRKEDMQVYMLRLLLEYARLCDDNREELGFVGDLREKTTKLN